MLADFEMLKLCEVIVGPVSSNYAKTAAVESMLSRGYLTQNGMCAASRATRYVRPGETLTAGTEVFEQARGVEGMFSDCKAQGAR